MQTFRKVLSGVVGFCAFSALGIAEPVEGTHTKLELIADVETIAPGAEFHVGLQFQMEEHWHIYWKNPGASGLAPELDWNLPEGFEVGAIQWPAPERIELGGLINYGYEGVVTFILPMRAPETIEPGQTVDFKAKVFFLICKEVCLPGDATVTLSLPVAETSEPGQRLPEFEAARARHPLPQAPWAVAAMEEGEQLHLDLEVPEGVEIPADLYFYGGQEGWIDPNEPQAVAFSGGGEARLSLKLDGPFFSDRPQVLTGVFQSGEGNWAAEISLFQGGGGSETDQALVMGNGLPEAGGFEGFLLKFGLPGWLVLAFLGGLILNIMPCVLPVLSLKVFSLLRHSGQTRGRALLHGLAYTAGVVASFLLLAGVLFVLRAVGEGFGWGFQLQSPNFIVILSVIFFLFGLNLMGVFEIGSSLVGADSKVSRRNDLLGSFGMGVLAAVVGAPCMGPLVASVSGIAVQADVTTGLLIFGMMGFGLASPFLFLAIFPKLVAYLPKPGIWMESFKQFMGFLLMAAVVFLALVAGSLGGVDAIIILLGVLWLVGLAAWIYGRWSVPSRPKRARWMGRVLSAVLLVGAVGYGIQTTQAAFQRHGASLGAVAAADGQWGEWSRERVEAELAEGHPVFVDFTATWCLICQVNKRVALRTEATSALFAEYGIVALEADWTRYNSDITSELERYGRSGVPLYLLISPDGETTILPQSLTNGTIREAVERQLR